MPSNRLECASCHSGNGLPYHNSNGTNNPIRLIMHTPLLHTPIHETDGELRELLVELERVTGLRLSDHATSGLFSYLTVCRSGGILNKPTRIDASGCYVGSILKTQVGKLPEGPVLTLVSEIADNFNIPLEMVVSKRVYIFLNEAFNPKSKLRKPAPIRW